MGVLAMARFLCVHTMAPNSMSREQVDQIAQAAQRDPVVKGYRSFLSLSEGKAACILDAPDKESLSDWFRKMQIPWDSISLLEMEGERGRMEECAREVAIA